MKVQTFSILAGSTACNARCSFCVSKMTPSQGVTLREPEVNWRNFDVAARLAQKGGAYTAMITSKGEPTLFPDQVSKYLDALRQYDFPVIELQTNGIALYEQTDKYTPYLQAWYDKGLTTVAVSIVHYDAEKNREIYSPHKSSYIDLESLISRLHEIGYSVRLAGIMARGYIEDAEGLERLIGYAREHKVEQLTVRPVNAPAESLDADVAAWSREHMLTDDQLGGIERYLEKHGTQLMTMTHGATVYDVDGQNVCLANSLTLDAKPEEIRQIIFFPDGHVRYDWQYPGAVIV